MGKFATEIPTHLLAIHINRFARLTFFSLYLSFLSFKVSVGRAALPGVGSYFQSVWRFSGPHLYWAKSKIHQSSLNSLSLCSYKINRTLSLHPLPSYSISADFFSVQEGAQ